MLGLGAGEEQRADVVEADAADAALADQDGDGEPHAGLLGGCGDCSDRAGEWYNARVRNEVVGGGA
jgi:hypothetical protein